MDSDLRDARNMVGVAYDLEFLSELEQKRKASGMHEAEIITVKIKQFNQYLNKTKPVNAKCVVCANEDPSTWKDARVDTMRKEAHCLRHKAKFHRNDQGVKIEQACISCDIFEPGRVKINEDWMKRVLGPKGESAVVTED